MSFGIRSTLQPLLVLYEEELEALADALDLGAHLLSHPDRALHVLLLLISAFGHALLELLQARQELLVLRLHLVLLLLHLLDYLEGVVDQVDALRCLQLLLLLGLVLAKLLADRVELGLQPPYLLAALYLIEGHSGAKLSLHFRHLLLVLLLHSG